MERFEDVDDTHFCIKCNITIQGLENYIHHRQSSECHTKSIPHEPQIPKNVTYPEILNADAFFNSLELQSSSKSNPRRALSSDCSRKFRGKRSERQKKNQKSKDLEDCKEKLHNISPVTDLDNPTDHLEIPQLLEFSDIDSNKPSTSARISTHSQIVTCSKMDNSDYHGKHERKRQNSQRSDSDHPVWLGDTLLTDLVETSMNKASSSTNLERLEDFDYHQTVDSEADSSGEDLEEDESPPESEDEEPGNYPPMSYTGGKWKPGEESQNISHNLRDDEIEMILEDDSQDQSVQHHPPPSHTGGKWRPGEPTFINQKTEDEDKIPEEQPPPDHTSGKWIPGARADTATGYWCTPCNRNLSSLVQYNKHLNSDLHARRNMQEIDGVVQFPQSLYRKSERQRALLQKRMKKGISDEESAGKKRLRKREKEILTCEMCCIRVRRTQMGKHLLSHYHCRVAGANPFRAKAQQFLLENMENIVRQSPFQCAPCHFYCNTEETFLLHWRSFLHMSTINEIDGIIKCTPCAFWCDENSAMEAHLLSPGHRDVIDMLNNSIPVVISKHRSLICQDCNQIFRYNIQLYQHAKQTGHEVHHTATDEYQKRIRCGICDTIFRSLIALQRHQLSSHVNENKNNEDSVSIPAPYFCSYCSLSFETSKDAILHRRTISHKDVVRAAKSESTGTFQECPHCTETLRNRMEYKSHLLKVHSELCHRCPKCAVTFALPQDLTRHTRDGECVPQRTNVGTSRDNVEWKCNMCPYSTDLQSEFIFHEALHAGPVTLDSAIKAANSKSSAEFRCPLCKKCFSKASLRNHITSHTGDRPFPCPKCSRSFSRRKDLNVHRKVCEGSSSTTQSLDKSERQKKSSSNPCQDSSYTGHEKDDKESKNTAGKQHACPFVNCDFRALSTSHIKRHVRTIHTNEKPYKCRHCKYASSTLENLRKHVLSTTLHSGKTIYECDVCIAKGLDPFTTNFSKELRAHLINSHSDRFEESKAVNDYMARIFESPSVNV